MITTDDASEWVPHGRDVVARHPKYGTDKEGEGLRLGVAGVSLLGDDLMSPYPGAESWSVANDGEELYYNTKTVVVSKGGQTLRCYTVRNLIKQALRCTFHSYPDRPWILSTTLSPEPEGEPIASVCITDDKVLRVFTDDGRQFGVTLQFAVRKCWPTKFGLLVERQVADGCQVIHDQELDQLRNSNVLLFLMHPLDDYTKVAMKQGNKMWELQDNHHVIIYTSSEPSLAVTYNTSTDTHSVWRVRRATQFEADNPPETNQNQEPSSAASQSSTIFTSCTPSRIHSTNTASPSQSRSLGTPFHSRQATPIHSRSQSRSNSPMSSMATMIRTGDRPGGGVASPSLLSRVQSRLASPCPRSPGSPGHNMTMDSSYQDTQTKPPMTVSMVLEHLWTEPSTPVSAQSKECRDKAAKVFLATDLVGQQNICFLRPGPSPVLQLVKMEAANDNPDRIIFGAVRQIPAQDAVPITGLNMILVLDLTGSLVLYSGISRVSKIMLPPSPTTILSQEISALALDNVPSFDSAPCTPLNIKKSSLLTSSRPPSAALPTFGNHDSSVGFLSPVVSDPCTHIIKLRDPLPLSCTLEYSNNRLMTISLPPVASSLVTTALDAIKLLLPRELATLLHVTWYNDRHAPGPCPAPDKEWDMFCRTLLGLAGYQVDLLDLSNTSNCSGPVPAKKCRSVSDDSGCDNDWQQLLVSPHHSQTGDMVTRLLGLDHPLPDNSILTRAAEQHAEVSSQAPLFPYIPAILWSLHLLYQEAKLDSSLHHCLPHLASLLSQLANDLQLPNYQHQYWQDYPNSVLAPAAVKQSQLSQAALAKLSPAPHMTPIPPNIITHLTSICNGATMEPFPLLSGVTNSCQLLATCMSLLNPDHPPLDTILRPLPQPGRPLSTLPSIPVASQPQHSLALLLSSHGWTRTRLCSLPVSVSVPLLTCLAQCQVSPPPGWSQQTYQLIGREDLGSTPTATPPQLLLDHEYPDGLEGLESDVSRARWSKDQRLLETRRLLQSSRPVTIPITIGPGVSDHDFMEEQENYLKRLCDRTMALPVGRGVAGLRTVEAMPTETLDIPKLCLSGKAPPRGAKVELSNDQLQHNMEHWPAFHNGVAAGLRLSTRPESTDINSSWINFNKPKNTETNSLANTEHAGFLMALGLNGHLTKLSKLDSYEYLIKGSEAISIGLLIGTAASWKGSMNCQVNKKIATQLPALLPPTATDMPQSHNTQVAALMSVGLLYSGTAHRAMVEVCLKELGKPPGPELENCVDRESYSLTAGLAMGFIMMGKGDQLTSGGLADLHLPSVLHSHMVGGPRPKSFNRERPPHSYQIMEGDSINIDITSPGATLALGMMYWNTNNLNIANWMNVPETSFLLEFVRPDFLMLRTIAKGLIMWEGVVPSIDWVEDHVPIDIRPHCLVSPPDHPLPGLENLDYETINQAYCNIIAGACFVLGLRFAGTWNASAVEVLNGLTNKLLEVSKRSKAKLIGSTLIEQTVCVLVLAQGMVMAGSGDLGVMRLCRMLRAKVHGNVNDNLSYGSYMAVHMALGLLFLGGGKFGLSTSPEAIAAMICAFYPKFPTHSYDNRYHLQALRHLYVLAVEPRVLVARCSDTGNIVNCGVEIQLADTAQYRGIRLEVMSPVLLPSLSLLSSVSVCDQSYWSTVFRIMDTQGWSNLLTILSSGGDVSVKRKTGAGVSQSLQWSLSNDQVSKLSVSSAKVTTYLSSYLTQCPQAWVSMTQCVLSASLATGAPDLVSVWSSLLSPLSCLDTNTYIPTAEQIHTIISLARSFPGSNSVQAELALSLAQRTNSTLDKLAQCHNISQSLGQYLSSDTAAGMMNSNQRQVVASTALLHSIPFPSDQYAAFRSNKENPLKLAKFLKQSTNPASLFRILNAS